MGVILKVTALFLGLFLVQLVVYGIHELAESGMFEGSQAFHDATELFGPDGGIGHALSYSLLGGAAAVSRVGPPRAAPPSGPRG